jgi:drug/metabolite transporter (DMT)-like permease
MSIEQNNSQDWRVDYLLLAALWGSSFLFMRMGASEFGPLATAWTRVFVATLFLAPLMLQQGHWLVFKKHWKLVLGFGVFNSALPFALFAYAVLHISTGLSAILNASVPLFAALVAWIWLGDRLNQWRIAGLFIGFIGVSLLANNQTSYHSAANPDTSLWGQYTAIAACLLATLCYAISGSFTKKYMPNMPPLVSSTGSQLGASLALTLPAFWAMPATMPSPKAWTALIILGVACTGIAYILYFRLVNRAGPAKALTVTFLIPVFALVYGVAFLNETVTWGMMLLGVVVVFGTALSSGLFPKAKSAN